MFAFLFKNLCIDICITFSFSRINKLLPGDYFLGIGLEFGGREMFLTWHLIISHLSITLILKMNGGIFIL